MATTHDASERKAAAGAIASTFGVLEDCHRRTLVAIADLESIVRQLEAGGADAPTRALAADVVRHFSTTARQHHDDEELHVFPRLAATGGAAMKQAILRLQQDHRWIEEDWMELLPHLDAVACGQTWYDVALLREGIEIFAALSRDHIAFEESCLYPEARARMGAADEQAMSREMTARRRAARRAATGAGPRSHP